MVLISVLALLAGCSGGGDSDSGNGECTNTVAITNPTEENINNAYYRTTVEATFDEKDDSAKIEIDGVSGTQDWRDDNTLVFTPDSPFAPSTTYNGTVTYACGTPTFTFKTSEVGSQVDAASLVGRTYNLDLSSGRFVEPEGIGAILSGYLTVPILIGVVSADTEIEMIGAVGVEGSNPPAQDICAPTMDFPEATFTDNPYFQIGPANTIINVSDYSIEIQDLFVAGAFAPNGDYIAGAVLKGSVDTRPLATIMNEECVEGGPDYPACLDEICNLAAGIGVACEPCGDGQNYCLSIHVDSILAAEVDTTLQEIVDECVEHPEQCPEDCATDTGGGT